MCNGFTRRDFLRNSVIGGIALGTGLGGYQSAYGQTTNLRFSTWHTPLSREVKTVWEPMLEEIKKKSGGKITSTMYAGSALGKGAEHFDIVAKGLSDMGYFTATWTPGRFPLSDVLSLAVWVDGKDLATDIGNAMYERILHREFKDVKVIELNGCIQSFLWTKKLVQSLSDIKGLKIRSPGGHQTHYIKALGAEPIFMPLPDVYMAIETGTIDGLVTCPPLVLAFKLNEVAKHGIVTTFGCVTEGVIMNQDSWKKVPDDQKKVIEAVGHNPFRTTGGLTREAYKVMMKEIADKGVKLYTPPADEAERWFDGFREVTRKWVADLEGKGLPGKEVVKMYNVECEKRGVKCVAFPPEWK
ncbi:MAG: TRAP transporter substrate-binding protein [Thermodesulfobacteriota bacterium]|nr:TRAP transporter substrate-binding protein [Thermodesulfobacteriota bacterium]